MTRTRDEIDEALRLRDAGLALPAIVRATGTPRSTVRDWLAGAIPVRAALRCEGGECRANLDPAMYSHLLGVYLGDGYIARFPRDVYRLTLYQDARYTRLVAEWRELVESMLGRSASVGYKPGCAIVTSYSKHWPCFFPQAGPGPKHLRPIVLEGWQRALVEAHPRQLLRGLIESDGCRHLNRVVIRGKAYEYSRYTFSNASADIRRIFSDTCDRLGVRWTKMTERQIAVSRRRDCAYLDTFIGPKS